MHASGLTEEHASGHFGVCARGPLAGAASGSLELSVSGRLRTEDARAEAGQGPRQPRDGDVEGDPSRPDSSRDGGDEGHTRPPEGKQEKIAAITAGMAAYMGVTTPTAVIERLVEEAYATQDEIFGKEKAAEWGGQFEIPQAAVDSDEALLKANSNNFVRMAEQRFQQILPSRLNEERVKAVISADNPERERLLGLAAGMEIPLPTGFRPNGKLDYRTGEHCADHTGAEPLRQLYVETAPAVNKQLMKLHGLGLAFLLTAPTVYWMLKGDHKMVASWAAKACSEAGRVLMDPSHTKVKLGSVMNGKEVKAACEKLWGPIQHPTITDLIGMVVNFFAKAREKDPTVRWEDLVLWKMDLRAAFTLLSVAPKNTPLFTMNLTGGLVIIVLCGLFGWTGTPFAFQVVTRAIVHELQKIHSLLMLGALLMYVDDIMGVCFRKDLLGEQGTARRVCTGLLGPTAVAEDKTEDGRALVWIGYLVDLDRQLVNMSPRNFRKCLYCFFVVDLTKKVPVKTLERLASLAERYSELYPYMRPFQRALYASYTGLNDHVSVDMARHPEAVRAIRFWRVMLCAAALDEERFARTFESFLPKTPQYIVEFDGCLQGVGILVYEQREDGSEVLRGGGAMDLGPLNFGVDSAYQNLGEFFGPTLAPVVLRALGLVQSGPCLIHLRGDSVTGLKWAATRRFKGNNVSNAAMVFTAMVVGGVVEVTGVTHIPAEKNKRADGLSRHKTMSELGMGDVPFVDLSRDPVALEIRELCDPALDVGTDERFAAHWRRSHAVALSLSLSL